MKLRMTILVLTTLLILPVISGCIFTPDLDRIQRMVANEIEPATMKTQVKLNLGPIVISLARFVTKLTDVEDEVLDYLACIKRVEVNVQEISGLSSLRSIRWPKGIERKLERDGWETLVKAREEDEIVLVLYKTRKRTVHSLYVLSLSPEELVLVKVEGRLDTFVTRALEYHSFANDWTASF